MYRLSGYPEYYAAKPPCPSKGKTKTKKNAASALQCMSLGPPG